MGLEPNQWLHPTHVVAFDEWELLDFAVFSGLMLTIGYFLMRHVKAEEKKMIAARGKRNSVI
jgi:hypothetical protein